MAKGHSFLNHKLHSLLGLFPIGLFLLFHLTANYQATRGPEAFNQVVGMIENVPFLLAVEFIFIYIPILFHAVYGIYIAFQAKHNVGSFGHFRNHMFLWQRLTGIITLIFVAWHVYETRIQKALGAEVNFDMMTNILSSPLMVVFYTIGILSTVFHFSNGLWSFLVHWGITVGPRSQRFATYLTMGIFVIVSLIGLRAMSAFIL
ncbi:MULTISPECIES: succinate dehydrogenase cytochrome b558 subunit [Brevibacillus]|jgi:succinate dehydrogenase / fumarate reductase cytochrome b subunit|uniref:Succinate dehydrogenase n=1 Tax=Brevibacillus aydinogluensis TaxID=927786 RepID=A0AA48MC58_9BACL|nr:MULTISPECIES: succinate dehydrogenase cytochrome b558 subunit [Brevibacillus]REK63336.1 MAG: succinate dehydrogenase [Brevibacillus sp.]MBR8660167.1 succinate dehydrogenase cytochrome b558 subunit [Brevibacillus sp. NL20B1]MDT3414251.1 succinate dehydrogenase / fumarate reductase cytochrome b subunit [Brevibacillus aydinogluensis]NNV03484.1 succinate dehydrogenase [Brevibacillus sp. MCWH]CAJ1003535.1 Succinate dehydrogenase [Brevibacillus aydinogluensis]